MKYVTRINLKTDCDDRAKLIDFCLTKNKNEQYIAIGWSYGCNDEMQDFSSFYDAVKRNVKRINPVFNIFKETKENDLFWTRDLEGNYWICRATAVANPMYNEKLDIGAVVPVEAHKVGLEVPGQIKASFNRPNGGTAARIWDDKIVEYSKYIFNEFSNEYKYNYEVKESSIIDNLPDFDLEELVIIYLQIVKDYYVLSNSIAKKSTTINIECELVSRNTAKNEKAVVQIKGGNNKYIDALDYEDYAKDGYLVYLYAPAVGNVNANKNFILISRDEIIDFYKEYKQILPNSITKWENLFKKI